MLAMLQMTGRGISNLEHGTTFGQELNAKVRRQTNLISIDIDQTTQQDIPRQLLDTLQEICMKVTCGKFMQPCIAELIAVSTAGACLSSPVGRGGAGHISE